jgi:hypothetical protein
MTSHLPDASSSESSIQEFDCGVDEFTSKPTDSSAVSTNVNAAATSSCLDYDTAMPSSSQATCCGQASTIGNEVGIDFVAFGGIDLSSINDGPPGRLVAGYDSAVDAWKDVSKPMSRFLHHHGVAVVNQIFYVVGEYRLVCVFC